MSKFKEVLKDIQKEFGKDSATILGLDGASSRSQNVIPTGLDVLDNYIIGCGGLPEGRIVELFSEESGGKSTLSYTFLAAAQRAGGIAVLAETEQVLDPTRAVLFGVNLDELIILNGEYIEELITQFEKTLDSIADKGAWPCVIVWDSVAQTPTKAEHEEGFIGGGRPGDRAKCLSLAMRTLAPKISRGRTCFVAINQVRDNIGVMFGSKHTTPGGHAIKFAASVRLQIFGGKAIKAGTEHIGKDITLMAMKNKMAPPFRKSRIRLNYETGWEDEWNTINHAKDRGVIPKGVRFGAAGYAAALLGLGWTQSFSEEKIAALKETASKIQIGKVSEAVPGEIDDTDDTDIAPEGDE